jgi:hypothetical protein
MAGADASAIFLPEGGKSFTAEDAEGAKERKSPTAKEIIIRTRATP